MGNHMKGKRTMAELQEVILRIKLNQSIRAIHKELGIHRTIIRSLKSLAAQHGWLQKESPIPNEELLRKALLDNGAVKSHPLEVFKDEIKEWLEKGMSFVVMHRLIMERRPCSEATLRRFVKRTYPKIPRPVMIRDHVPGEYGDVDFGYLGMFYDPDSQLVRKTWLFSFRLRYSRKAYREVVFDQSERTFFFCHIHAFEYIQGVPATVVIDNLKAGVIRAAAVEPLINKTYLQLAAHYKFLVSPCRPYTPRHKGGVENDVKYVKNNFLPFFIEKEKGQEVPSVSSLKKALESWNNTIAETRKIGGVGRTVHELFEEEKSLLKQLPEQRWEYMEWIQAKVGADWRIRYDKIWYSVPHTVIGKVVHVCVTHQLIRVFYEGQEIALHQRSFKHFEYVRSSFHAPIHQEEVLNSTRCGLIAKAEQLNVLNFVEKMFEGTHEDKLKPVRLLLGLAKKYGGERLKKACVRAAHFELYSYKSVKDILLKDLDAKPFEEDVPASRSGKYHFSRPKTYYDQGDIDG